MTTFKDSNAFAFQRHANVWLFAGIVLATVSITIVYFAGNHKHRLPLLSAEWKTVLSPLPPLFTTPDKINAVHERANILLQSHRTKQGIAAAQNELQLVEEQFGPSDYHLYQPLRLLVDPAVPPCKEKIQAAQRIIRLKEVSEGRESLDIPDELNRLVDPYLSFNAEEAYKYFSRLAADIHPDEPVRAVMIYACAAQCAANLGRRDEAERLIKSAVYIQSRLKNLSNEKQSVRFVRALGMDRIAQAAHTLRMDDVSSRFSEMSIELFVGFHELQWAEHAKQSYYFYLSNLYYGGRAERLAEAMQAARKYLLSLPPEHREEGVGWLYDEMSQFCPSVDHPFRDETMSQERQCIVEFEKLVGEGTSPQSDYAYLELMKARMHARMHQFSLARLNMKRGEKFAGNLALFSQSIKQLEGTITAAETASKDRCKKLERAFERKNISAEAANLLCVEMATIIGFAYQEGRVNREIVARLIELYSRFVAIVPLHSKEYVTCTALYTKAKSLQAMDENRFEEALNGWKKCLSLTSVATVYRRSECEDWICYLLLREGRISEAREHLRQLSSIAGKHDKWRVDWYKVRYPEVTKDH